MSSYASFYVERNKEEVTNYHLVPHRVVALMRFNQYVQSIH